MELSSPLKIGDWHDPSRGLSSNGINNYISGEKDKVSQNATFGRDHLWLMGWEQGSILGVNATWDKLLRICRCGSQMWRGKGRALLEEGPVWAKAWRWKTQQEISRPRREVYEVGQWGLVVWGAQTPPATATLGPEEGRKSHIKPWEHHSHPVNSIPWVTMAVVLCGLVELWGRARAKRDHWSHLCLPWGPSSTTFLVFSFTLSRT